MNDKTENPTAAGPEAEQPPIDGTDAPQAASAQAGPQVEDPRPELAPPKPTPNGTPPVQAVQIRPGKDSRQLALIVANRNTGQAIRCEHLHPRVTLELDVQADQVLVIQPADPDSIAELHAWIEAQD